MRSAGNFHPEWGYLAPAPSFMRTVRVALVATAIGAVGGAVVVVSLVERPGTNDTTAIAAHALLTRAPVIKSPAVVSRAAEPAVAKPAPSAPQAAVATSALSMQPAVTGPSAKGAASPAPSEVASVSKPDKADSISPPLPLAKPADGAVAAADATPLPAEADAAVAPDTATERRATTRKSVRRHRYYESYRRQYSYRRRWRDNGGFGPLFGLFSFRTGSPYSSN